MDSGSASLQSSSGGGDDQEYDSRVESISSFLNSSTNQFPNSLSNSNPVHPPPPPSFFDLSSPYSVSQNNPPLYNNFDPLWSRNLRPDTTSYTNFAGANNNNNNNNLGSQSGLNNQTSYPGPSTGAARAPTQPDHHQNISNVGVVAKNPKKRTRASRRAPTTVLTTDTSNFRQMVQEFTGIPAAPFSAGSSPFSRRLDLFGVGVGGGGDGGVGPLYPLRPSAQKRQLSSQYLTSPSSFLNSSENSNNYQQQEDTTTTTDHHHGFPKQTQTLLNLQNPLFTFQSLLQQQNNNNDTLLPNAAAAAFPQKPHEPIPSMNNPLTGFPSSSSTTKRWKDHGSHELGENLGGGFNASSQNVRGGYKLHNSSSDFDQTDKGLENVVNSSRGGTDHQGNNVDSWISPTSD